MIIRACETKTRREDTHRHRCPSSDGCGVCPQVGRVYTLGASIRGCVWMSSCSGGLYGSVEYCRAAPHRPVSLIVAQPRNQRKSPETAKETSTVYWKWDLTGLKQRVLEWCLALHSKRQAGHGNSLLSSVGRRRLPLRGELTSGWPTHHQGDQHWGKSCTASQVNNPHEGRWFPLTD